MDIKINIKEKVIPIDIQDRDLIIEVQETKEIIVNVPKTLDEKIIEKIPKVSDGKEGKKWPKGEKGDKGEQGEKWDKGDKLTLEDLTPYEIQRLTWAPWNAGEWVARGGTTWQVLVKKSDRNYDTEWTNWGWWGSDTLQSVTDRGATTTNVITVKSEPTFTYLSGVLTDIDYADWTTKDFTYNPDGTLNTITITYLTETVVKTMVWSSWVLQNILIS